MNCKVCEQKTEKCFDGLVRNKYLAAYFECPTCGFVQTEDPKWIEEAYENAINPSDTGPLARGIALSELVSIVLYYFFDRTACFLDYAGGYGIFTRLMRDVGYDFYWCDKYCENIFSQKFEYNDKQRIELLTAFEVFEHLTDPLVDLEKMVSISRNLIFTTELLPTPLPAPNEWWYYGLEHGQHIAFYTEKSLKILAARFGLHYCRFNGIHLMTQNEIPKFKRKFISLCYRKFRTFELIKRKMVSKTFADMQFILRTK